MIESEPAGADLLAGGHLRPAWAEIDLDAIRHNAGVLRDAAAPAQLCAVVKASGYGHGAVEVSRAALEGGAAWLAVALVEEGLELRDAGIEAPILILSQPSPAAMRDVVVGGLTPTLYTVAGVDALREAVLAAEEVPSFSVHVKVDTGMHRVGAAVDDAVALAVAIDRDPLLRLEGFWTHLAVSDQVDDPYTARQLTLYSEALDELQRRGVRPAIRHAANSGGTMWHPSSRYDMVRCGIALYGLAPSADGMERAPADKLIPAMSLKALVAHVKKLPAGERLSYGLRYTLPADSVVATVPLGYADGVPRPLSEAGGVVLVAGRRRRIAGTVTMDQILVDCGPDADVSVGDEVVLFGTQDGESISAWEWASLTGTIAYENVCRVSARVPRVYVNG